MNIVFLWIIFLKLNDYFKIRNKIPRFRNIININFGYFLKK